MNIYVSEDLEYIRQELKIRGYNIIDDNKEPCDVIICNLKNEGLTDVNMQSNVKKEGTLIIDSSFKTVDEIEYILNSRVYSSFL